MIALAQTAKRTLSALRKDEEGAALTEFAFVIGPFLLIVIGLIDFGYRGYVGIVADSVAHRVARMATTGTITVNQVEAAANRRLEPLVLADADVVVTTRSYYDFTGVGRPETITVDANDNGSVDDDDCFIDENNNGSHDNDVGIDGIGGADDVVVYEITITSDNLTGISEFLDSEEEGFTVEASATGRNQPFADQEERNTQEYCIVGGESVAV